MAIPQPVVPSAVVDAEHGIPDERPQRRREYSGAPSTLGLAALLIVVVGVAVWWFELRGDGGGLADDGHGVIDLPAGQNPTGRAPAADTGRAAPNFTLARIDESAAVSLTDYRGRWVLLNFWASWCGPCRGEAPDLQAFSERQAAKAVVLGVNQQEPAHTARAFAADFGLDYPLVLDRRGEVSNAYRVGGGLPVTMLIDPTGVIRAIYPGRITMDQLAAIEREYLQ